MKSFVWIPIVALLFSACSDQGGEFVDKKPGDEAPVVQQPQATAQSPHGAMMHGMGVQPPDVDKSVNIEGTNVTIGDLACTVDASWISQEPTSSMRAAQFQLPGAEGEKPGELILYRGIGGSNDANIQRWVQQIQQPDGSDSATKAKIETGESGEFKIMTLDVSGSFTASMMAGGGASFPEARMLAIAVEGPGGPYHFKAIGPAKTMEQWKPAFDALAASIKKAE